MASSSSSLAAQGKLNSMTDKFGGRTPVRVHFLDNSSKMFLLDEEVLAKDLIQTILDKFEVKESGAVVEYFGLFEALDGHSIGAALNPDDKVVEHVQAWGSSSSGSKGKSSSGDKKGTTDSAKLVFMIRLFMPCLWGLEYKDRVAARLGKPASTISTDLYLDSAAQRDDALIHLQYIQALYHVITSQYPTSEEEALKLGAFHFVFKFGDFKPDVHKVGFLGMRIVEFIPIKMLRLHDLEDWEGRLMEHLKDFTEHDHHEKSVQRLYMEDVYRMNIFGSTFFRCNQRGAHNLPQTVILAVQFDGIEIFEPKNRSLLLAFRIEEVLRWGFKPNAMFYFEVKPTPDLDGTIEFDTTEGRTVSDLLTDYALAFIHEKTHEDERALADHETAHSAEEEEHEHEHEHEHEQEHEEAHGEHKGEHEHSEDEHEEGAHSKASTTAHAALSPRGLVQAAEAEAKAEEEEEEEEAALAAAASSADSASDSASELESESEDEAEAHAHAHAAHDKGHSHHEGGEEDAEEGGEVDEQLKNEAATLIQAAVRGHLGRLEVSELIEQMMAEAEEEDFGEEM